MFVGSDATGTRGDGRSGIIAAIDYQNHEWTAAPVSQCMNILMLRRDARKNEDSLIAAAVFDDAGNQVSVRIYLYLYSHKKKQTCRRHFKIIL